MQRQTTQARMNAIDSPQTDAQNGAATHIAHERLSSADQFERARITAADDPALGQLWNALFDDANP